MVERGYVIPGSFVVASDSHSICTARWRHWNADCPYGCGRGVGHGRILVADSAIDSGRARRQVAGRRHRQDVIITLCGLYNHDECLNAAVEFTGPGVASLSMDARLSISNMTTEWGPLVGWFPVDEVTIRYLRDVMSG